MKRSIDVNKNGFKEFVDREMMNGLFIEYKVTAQTVWKFNEVNVDGLTRIKQYCQQKYIFDKCVDQIAITIEDENNHEYESR